MIVGVFFLLVAVVNSQDIFLAETADATADSEIIENAPSLRRLGDEQKKKKKGIWSLINDNAGAGWRSLKQWQGLEYLSDVIELDDHSLGYQAGFQWGVKGAQPKRTTTDTAPAPAPPVQPAPAAPTTSKETTGSDIPQLPVESPLWTHISQKKEWVDRFTSTDFQAAFKQGSNHGHQSEWNRQQR